MTVSKLLRPKTLAIVGASPKPESFGASLLQSIRYLGFPGEVHLVNPRYERIDGQPCYPDVASIPGGVDSKNPDKAKRTRPLLGIPVLLNMKKVEDEKDKWEGKVYNAEDGKTYDASIQLKAPNALRVEGCLVWPLCGGQTWSRVDSSAAPGGAKTGATGSTGAKTAAPAPKSAQPSTQPSPFPTPIGSAPKSSKGSTAGKAPAATAATADPATTEICSLPEIAGAPH